MNMQAVLIRGAILLAMCFGLSVAVLHNEPVSGPVVALAAVTMTAKAAPRESAPTVLPTVSVRPSAKELALALSSNDDDSDNTATFIDVAHDRPLDDSPVTLRSLHLDMPYYSFGKALPRVSKE
jgi:hypothetical protein